MFNLKPNHLKATLVTNLGLVVVLLASICALAQPTPIIGDVNGDGIFDGDDVFALESYVFGGAALPIVTDLADVAAPCGVVDERDLGRILDAWQAAPSQLPSECHDGNIGQPLVDREVPDPPQPFFELEVYPPEVDFGQIDPRQTESVVEREVVVENTGTVPVEIVALSLKSANPIPVQFCHSNPVNDRSGPVFLGPSQAWVLALCLSIPQLFEFQHVDGTLEISTTTADGSHTITIPLIGTFTGVGDLSRYCERIKRLWQQQVDGLNTRNQDCETLRQKYLVAQAIYNGLQGELDQKEGQLSDLIGNNGPQGDLDNAQQALKDFIDGHMFFPGVSTSPKPGLDNKFGLCGAVKLYLDGSQRTFNALETFISNAGDALSDKQDDCRTAKNALDAHNNQIDSLKDEIEDLKPEVDAAKDAMDRALAAWLDCLINSQSFRDAVTSLEDAHEECLKRLTIGRELDQIFMETTTVLGAIADAYGPGARMAAEQAFGELSQGGKNPCPEAEGLIEKSRRLERDAQSYWDRTKSALAELDGILGGWIPGSLEHAQQLGSDAQAWAKRARELYEEANQAAIQAKVEVEACERAKVAKDNVRRHQIEKQQALFDWIKKFNLLGLKRSILDMEQTDGWDLFLEWTVFMSHQFGEGVTQSPIPLTTINVLAEVYRLILAFRDPRTALGHRLTVEKIEACLQKENPKLEEFERHAQAEQIVEDLKLLFNNLEMQARLSQQREAAARGSALTANPFGLNVTQLAFQSRAFVARGQGIVGLSVHVYDLSGALIYKKSSQGQTLRFTGLNDRGQRLANGVYLYTVTAHGADGKTVRGQATPMVVLN